MWIHVRHILMTNTIGAIAGLEYIKDYWVHRREPGHLVGISSVAGIRGLKGTAAYSSSKAALATYLESLQGELSKAGISVTCVYPGFVRTPMTTINPWMPWLVEAENAAQRIANAIEKRRKRFTFPFPMRIVRCLLKHMPDALYDFIARHSRSYKKVD
jgi:short-subunit dehydrogenase